MLEFGPGPIFEVDKMNKLLLCAMVVVAATPAWSQTKPKAVAGHNACAPIGQTANRELVYPMSCNNLPAPPPLPPQAELQQAPVAAAPEPEVRRGGLFGMSFDAGGGNSPTAQGRSP
jgi:hypothetical protein